MKTQREIVGDRVLCVMLVVAVIIGAAIGLMIGLTVSEPSVFEL